jgi:hypothetical protein
VIQLHNQYGQIDLSIIDPNEVAELSDEGQLVLSLLISAVQDRQAAQQRFNSATLALREAAREQEDAMAAHIAANPPQTPQQAQQDAIAAYNASY